MVSLIWQVLYDAEGRTITELRQMSNGDYVMVHACLHHNHYLCVMLDAVVRSKDLWTSLTP